jgi:hypothetical protein
MSKAQLKRTQPAHPKSLDRRPSAEKPIPEINVWIAVGIFAALALIFHSSILMGGKFLWEDFVEQEFPFRTFAATSLAQGVLPHWNPYIFGGMPFMADIQTAFWYPTNLLQTLFVSDGHLSAGVMQWFILMHYAVAGAGMYLFAKRILGVDDWSALFAGIAYAFGGFIVAQAIHQMIVYQMALFPLVALAFIAGIDNWRYSIVSGILLGVMYLAGHPQSTLFFTFLLAMLAIYELTFRTMRKERMDAGAIIRAAIPVIIAIGLFAIQLLPSQELAGLSRREVMTYEKSVDGSLSFGNLLTLVLPRLFGVTDGAHEAKVPFWNGAYYLSWETAIYIGIFPLFFGILAAMQNWKRKYVPFFAYMSLFAILFALGDHFFIYRIFFNLPLFDKLRTPARMSMVFSFSMCALSAIGFRSIFERTKKEAIGTGALVGAGAIILVWIYALVGGLHASSFLPGVAAEADASIGWAAGLATFPVLALAAYVLARKFSDLRGMILAIPVIAVTLIELFTYGMGLNAVADNPADLFREQPQLIDQVKQDQAKEITRARTRMGSQILVKRNQGAYDRIQLIEGYNPLVLQRVSPETFPEEQADLMNIKWSIIQHGQQPDFGARSTYLPRVKLYYKTEVRSDTMARVLLKTDSLFDYRNTILIEEQPPTAVGPLDAAGIASITHYSENEITVKVKTAAPAMLFLSEVYYPAWNAYIDGAPSKIYRAFTSLRAVEVPAGEHTVVLKYESKAFATGSMISLATLLLSIGGFVFFMLREKKATPEPEPAAPEQA